MKPKKGFWKLVGLLSALSLVFLSGCSKLAVLNPQGPVAKTQSDLIIWSMWMMLIVVVVVFAIFIFVLVKYREKPENMDYEPPEQEGNLKMEVIWTAFPIIILILLAVPTVKAIYSAEEVPAESKDKDPIVIHVTSANWKWIFSYPEQNIETVNYVNIPADTPVKFELTSQGPMNSFWVPELGGQKYSMNNMSMPLYLEADKPGSYLGRSANFSGEHFTQMQFEVQAQTDKDFKEWVSDVKSTAGKLTEKKYDQILSPGVVGRQTYNGTHLKWVDHAKDVYIPGKELERGTGHDHSKMKEDEKTSNEEMENMDHSNHE
ncbi:cytochrome aa3 quinol oxidase subunit II [Priestia aryabhattai]|uniref:cytochrome aa3 quinol oxidase subunit II n=1 Tax=Priestia megaterium TaxID=1404 RepID=UPI0039B97EF6